LAIAGLCPGTAPGALGEGRIHALWAIVGMLFGAAYAEVYPALKISILAIGNLGKITLPVVLGINPWIVIVPMVILILMLFKLFDLNDM